MLMIGTSYSFCFLLKKRNIIKMFLVTALIVSLFLFSFGESSGNVMHIKNYRDRTQDVNLKIKNTPEKSVFFVITNDKVIIDTRPVFLCGEFEKGKKDINELFRIINLLEKDNYEIYLSKEAKNIKKEIIERGGKIIEIENFTPSNGCAGGGDCGREITSTVWWQEKGRPHKVFLKLILTDWRE